MKASTFFTPEQQEVIVRAIGEAEHSTSGEIRIHVETSCKANVLDEAAWLFKKAGMDKTADRNGILIYLALKERSFAIIVIQVSMPWSPRGSGTAFVTICSSASPKAGLQRGSQKGS
jgi:uncharacterized membrane protein